MKTCIPFILIFISIIPLLPSCKKGKDNQLAVGQFYQGGTIFYIDASGEHGFIASSADLRGEWSNGSATPTNVFRPDVGAGMSNTAQIVSVFGGGDYAARKCETLVLEGYFDWFLPSKDELYLLYQQKDKVGGFTSEIYWSSTEINSVYAQTVDFKTGEAGSLTHAFKTDINGVRPIRVF